MKNQVNQKTLRKRNSLLISIVSMVLGWIIPALFSVSGFSFFDKYVWKLLFSIALNVATLIVSLFFSWGVIRDEKSGNITKASIYFAVAMTFCSLLAILFTAFSKEDKAVYVIALAVMIIVLLVFYWFRIKNKYNQVKQTVKTVVEKVNVFKPRKSEKARLNAVANETLEPIAPRSLPEMWLSHGENNGSMFVQNCKNPNIEWVEISKKPYGKIPVFGNVKFVDDEKTQFIEVAYSDKKIWIEYIKK